MCQAGCPQVIGLSTDFRRATRWGLDNGRLKKGRSPLGWAGVCARFVEFYSARLWVGRVGGGLRWWRCLDFWARLPLLHHPDPSLSCNSFWGLSRRERCLDKPQKLLKKAWIGVMQKDWITTGNAAWLWHYRLVAGDAAGW